MFEREIKKYAALNRFADGGGTVIFGGREDTDIPLCELKQAFVLDTRLYNRSIPDLTVADAAAVYDACVAPLAPETLLLHLGAADLASFAADPAHFDRACRDLIAHIRAKSGAEIVIVSLRNPDNAPDVAEMNRHLKYIAESEQCEFGDISIPRVWNPRETKEVVSFVYSMGFVRPLKQKKPTYDLVKILYSPMGQ